MPLCVDLFCGLGGWTEAFLSEGYHVIGFDIERHAYGVPGMTVTDEATKGTKPMEKRGWTQGCVISLGMEGANNQPRTRLLKYPGQLALQDVLTLHGSQFRDAAVIVASPPCTEYSYMAMPWTRAKQIAAALREEVPFPEGYAGSRTVAELNALFDACFRIQREACEAAGHYIPLIVENVKGAQPWVGRAKAAFGSYYLWGDVESVGGRIVRAGVLQFGMPAVRAASRGSKQPGRNCHFPEKYGIPSPSFHGAEHEPSVSAAAELTSGVKCGGAVGDDWFTHHNRPEFDDRAAKNNGGSWFGEAHNTESGHSRNPVNGEGVKQHGSGEAWFDKALDERRKEATADSFGWSKETPLRNNNSKSNARKAASAMIAKIPYPLALHIAKCFKP